MIGTLLLPESILSSEEFPLKGCKITGTCAFRVHTKHDQTLFDCLFSSSLLPISVATNWLDLLRFANREPFQTQLSATYPDGMLQLKSTIKHIHSIWVHPRLHLMACWHILYNTWTTVEVGEWDSTEHRKREEEEDLSGVTLLAHELTDILAQRVKPKKLKRGIQRRIPPLPVFTVALLAAHPPSALCRSAYVVTNDTFIFLQRLCVCKTAEVHQDVKYFGWATQVALEDNQMEV